MHTLSRLRFSDGRRRLALLCLAPTLCLALTACKVDVYQNLTEAQANAMLATLLKHRIPAEKVAMGKTGFKLVVDDSRLIQSLEILQENNLPREGYDNMGDVFTGKGMISSASEEQARLSFALSQELADTFSRIDGVLTARVHVVLTTVDATTGTRTPPSAAVFLRHLPESQVTGMVAKIREVTSKSVPGLAYDHVSVMLVPVRETVGVPRRPGSGGLGTDGSSSGGIPGFMIPAGALIILAVLGLCGGAACLLRKRRKDESAGPA